MYLPFLKDQKFLYMGLQRLDPAHWFEPDAEWLEFHENKKRQLQRRTEQCFQALPESFAAQQELHHRVVEHLRQQHSDSFQIDDTRAVHIPSAEAIALTQSEAPLYQTALLVQDDLCLMQPSPDGYRLTAASLCAPSYWHLEEKIGQTLDQIHQPLPGYQAGLSHSMNRFFDRMKVNAPVWRANWSITAHPGLMQRLDTPTPGDLENDPLWLRVERQTLVRLPTTQAIAFGIRIHRYRLDEALERRDVRVALQSTLNSMLPEEKNYKSLARLQGRLTQLLNLSESVTG